jgi:hypothetical protein
VSGASYLTNELCDPSTERSAGPQQLAVGWRNGEGTDSPPLLSNKGLRTRGVEGKVKSRSPLLAENISSCARDPPRHTVPPWHRHVVSDRERAREFGVPASHGVPPTALTNVPSKFQQKGRRRLWEKRQTVLVQSQDITVCVRHNGRSRWPRGLRRRFWPIGCWDRGSESRSRHGFLSLRFCVVLSCIGRGLCDGLITRPKEFPVWGGQCPCKDCGATDGNDDDVRHNEHFS